VFAESGNGSERYCDDAPPLPTRDRFWDQMGVRQVTAYVVLDRAVTPEHPAGRADVFRTLQLRVTELRAFGDPEHQRPLMLGDPDVGTRCPDDPGALCRAVG
jgi:hypothetical protein